MKFAYTLFTVSIVAFAGCEKKEATAEATALTKLDSAFNQPTTETPANRLNVTAVSESLRSELTQVQEQLRAKDYSDAVLGLQKLQRATNLTAGQIAAINETMATAQARLIERAAQGDPRAKQAIADFQKNLPK